MNEQIIFKKSELPVRHFYLCQTCRHTLQTLISQADPVFGVRGDEIRQGDLRVLLLLSHMFMERMMQEN